MIQDGGIILDYRKLYSEQIGEPVPQDWDIHHLDGNRSNNILTNLVAIPKNIHASYHYLVTQCQLNFSHLKEFTNIVSEISSFGISGQVYFQRSLLAELSDNITRLQQVEKQIVHYIVIRDKKAGIGLGRILNAERF